MSSKAPHLKDDSPLAKPLRSQSSLKLEFANGSRLVDIPEGADQIRSYHPWGLFMDEAAFQPQAGEAYDAAVSRCVRRLLWLALPLLVGSRTL